MNYEFKIVHVGIRAKREFFFFVVSLKKMVNLLTTKSPIIRILNNTSRGAK